MRVAVVHSFYRSRSPSGENLAVRFQLETMRSFGWDVVPIFIATDEAMVEPFFKLRAGLRVGTNLGRSPLKQLEMYRPDLIHIHNLFPNWSNGWMRHLRIPKIVTVHNYRPFCSRGTLERQGERCELCPTRGSHHSLRHRCYQSSLVSTLPLAIATRQSSSSAYISAADGMIFLSERTRANYGRLGGNLPKNRVIPNQIPDYAAVVSGSTRHSSEEPNFVYCGRVSEEKGVPQLIEQWPKSLKLTVIGSGPEEARCRALARGKNVSFEGLLSSHDVIRFLAGAKAVIHPSLAQEAGHTSVYLETLCVGVPSIALSGTSVSDDILRNRTGTVVNRLSEIPTAVRLVDTHREEFSQNARQTYLNNHTAAVWMARVEDFYSSVIDSWNVGN